MHAKAVNAGKINKSTNKKINNKTKDKAIIRQKTKLNPNIPSGVAILLHPTSRRP